MISIAILRIRVAWRLYELTAFLFSYASNETTSVAIGWEAASYVKLLINGEMQGKKLVMNLGFSHPVIFEAFLPGSFLHPIPS